MSLEPEVKRRKMEPHVSGDDYSQEAPQSSSVLASKNLARAASASPSGDFGDNSHQFVALLANEGPHASSSNEDETGRFLLYKQMCEYGDSWSQKYKVPLSKCPQRPIRTGNLFYDGLIADMEGIGYKPLHVVARGKSGTIILAQSLHHTTDHESETVPVAIKLNSGKSRRSTGRHGAKAEMLEEMAIHRQLHHAHIVTWLANIDYNGRLGTVMEYCENGTLDELLKLQNARFITEGVARRYFRNILSAVEYIHMCGIAHRDICPQNILLTHNNTAKLGDFGHAVRVSDVTALCEDECGSLGYQAPEVLRKVAYNPRQADIWSLGATLYSICTGRPPLGTIRSDILEHAAREIPFPDTKVLLLTHHFRSLIKGTLTYIPDMRFSLNRIAHCEWMAQTDGRVQIGNFFRVRHPQKTTEGSLEHEIKTKLCI